MKRILVILTTLFFLTLGIFAFAEDKTPRLFSFVRAPLVSDDAASGYLIGDIWLDMETDDIYILLDPVVNGAIWKELRYNESYTPTPTSAVGYTLSAAELGRYNVIYIDTSPSVDVTNPMSTGTAGIGPETGVTVTCTLGPACYGKETYFINSDSGGTPFVLYIPGGTFSGATPISFTANRTAGEANVTSCTPFLTMDGYWDILHVRWGNSAVSGEVLDYRNR